MALASRQSLIEIQTSWTDEDLVTVLALLQERAEAQQRAAKRGGRRGR